MRVNSTKLFEYFFLGLLIVSATFIRLIFLDSLFPGLHGDEAWTALDAKVILEKGYIDVYTGNALGQPTGPLYVTALVLLLFGESVFSVRLSMALFGIASVLLFYFFLRLFFSRTSSFLGAFALCFSLIHLYFSRIAFMLISAPLFQLGTFILLTLGYKKKKKLLFLSAGAVMGLGMYSYNSYVIFPIILIILTFLYGLLKRALLLHIILFILTFFVVSSPLLFTMIKDPGFYFAHHKHFSVLNKNEVKMAKNTEQKIRFILENGTSNLYHFFVGNKVTYGDGFGIYRNFVFLELLLMSFGIFCILFTRRKRDIFFLLITLGLLTSQFLTYEGFYRRQIISIVLLYYFLTNAIDFLLYKGPFWFQKYAWGITFGLIIGISLSNLQLYYLRYPYNEDNYFTFGNNLTKGLLFAKANTSSSNHLLLYSERWGCLYETIRFILPDYPCEDRSFQFGKFNTTATKHNVIFLLDSYLYLDTDIKKKYPSSKRFEIFNFNKTKVEGIIYTL